MDKSQGWLYVFFAVSIFCVILYWARRWLQWTPRFTAFRLGGLGNFFLRLTKNLEKMLMVGFFLFIIVFSLWRLLVSGLVAHLLLHPEDFTFTYLSPYVASGLLLITLMLVFIYFMSADPRFKNLAIALGVLTVLMSIFAGFEVAYQGARLAPREAAATLPCTTNACYASIPPNHGRTGLIVIPPYMHLHADGNDFDLVTVYTNGSECRADQQCPDGPVSGVYLTNLRGDDKENIVTYTFLHM